MLHNAPRIHDRLGLRATFPMIAPSARFVGGHNFTAAECSFDTARRHRLQSRRWMNY
jgi:hypothetical protein